MKTNGLARAVLLHTKTSKNNSLVSLLKYVCTDFSVADADFKIFDENRTHGL